MFGEKCFLLKRERLFANNKHKDQTPANQKETKSQSKLFNNQVN